MPSEPGDEVVEVTLAVVSRGGGGRGARNPLHGRKRWGPGGGCTRKWEVSGRVPSGQSAALGSGL